MPSNIDPKLAGKVATDNEDSQRVHRQDRDLIYTEGTKFKAFLKVSRKIKNDKRRYRYRVITISQQHSLA